MNAATPSLTPDQHAFHIAEFSQLKSEAMELFNSIAMLARYALVGSVAAYSWLITATISSDQSGFCIQIPPGLIYLGSAMPALFVILSGIAACLAAKRASHFTDYFRLLETQLSAAHLGWEKFLTTRPALTKASGARYWCGLLIVTVALSILFLIIVHQHGMVQCATH